MTQRAQWTSAVVVGLLALPAPLLAQTGSVEIWMKAFMPDPGGGVVKLSLGNQDSECYATDHRGLSSDPSATAALETKFSLIPTGRDTAIVRPASQRTSTATTTVVDCSRFAVRDGVVHVAGRAIDNNGSSTHYSFDLTWRPFPGELTATVNVLTFPAFEMYARIPGREWVEVVRTPPSGMVNASLTQLSDSVTLPVLDGTWESDDVQRRFLLRIHGASVEWTERDAAGSELTRQSPLWFGDDAATISRANDDRVLAFLGFQPELREQILARSPIPSFITLKIDEQGLLAEWFGVLAIKDERDRLKTLVQPGDRAPKRFRLQRRSAP